MATRKKPNNKTETAEKKDNDNWDPERVRKFRMAYDKKVKEGILPKDVRTSFTFEGQDFNMAFAFYLLEYFETCIFWPPQSRVYAMTPDLED
jgi:hypothetical protein